MSRILVLALLVTATPSLAWQSGNELLRNCEGSDGKFCLGYIVGAYTVMQLNGRSGEASIFLGTDPTAQDQIPGFCVPNGVEPSQLIDTTMNYLRGHPELRHLPAPILMYNAFLTAFPCH